MSASPPPAAAPDPALVAEFSALDRRRNGLAALYFPWALLVFAPLLALSTLVCGTIAVAIAFVSQNAAWWMGKLWSLVVLASNFTRVDLHGTEHVDPEQSYVYMLNHQSHFDVLAFYSRWQQQFRWVVKQELRSVPGLGWYCAVGGHVFVDRRNHEAAVASLEKARQRLVADSVSIAFFPEGTRSRNGRLQPFKKGGFVMARQLGLPILPVSISGSHAVLPGKRLRLLPGRIRVTVHAPVDTKSYGEDQVRLMADTRAAIACGLTAWERSPTG